MDMAVIMIVMCMIVVIVAFMALIGCLVFIAMGVNMVVATMFVMVMFLVVMLMRLLVVRLLGMGQILCRILGLIGARSLDHGALHAVAMAAAARVAVARAAAVGAVFAFFLGLAMGALIGFDQRLPVGDRDLIIVGMDFAEGEEAVPVAAIFNEGGLE